MKSPSILFLLFITLIILISGCQGSESESIRTNEGPESIIAGLTLTRVDSIGIELGDSNYVFGSILDADFLPDGRIVLLDVLKDKVSIFSPNGDFLTSFGREGSGPGEFMEPASITVLSDGGICVADFMRQKLIYFDADFCYEREISGFLIQSPSSIESGSDGSVVGFQTHYFTEDDNFMIGSRLAKWTDSSTPELEYASRYNPHNGRGPVTIPYFFCATGSHGSVYCAESSEDQYTIMKFNAEGDSLFTIQESYTPMYRTEEEIACAHFGYILDTPGFDSDDRRAIRAGWEINPIRNAIRSIHIDGDERLWVATGRGESPSPQFEIYDSSGNHIYSYSTNLPAEMRWGYWKLVFGNDRILAFDNNPVDFSRVFVYEIDEQCN
ncbi:MAG: 6-bladed beta-propeller [Candidatus Sabulitectum sp.]|nr:6-bladed beta-propeller [Candidatus Sabulitectum sp.]